MFYVRRGGEVFGHTEVIMDVKKGCSIKKGRKRDGKRGDGLGILIYIISNSQHQHFTKQMIFYN